MYKIDPRDWTIADDIDCIKETEFISEGFNINRDTSYNTRLCELVDIACDLGFQTVLTRKHNGILEKLLVMRDKGLIIYAKTFANNCYVDEGYLYGEIKFTGLCITPTQRRVLMTCMTEQAQNGNISFYFDVRSKMVYKLKSIKSAFVLNQCWTGKSKDLHFVSLCNDANKIKLGMYSGFIIDDLKSNSDISSITSLES